jgi:hypothetical protein
VVVAEIEERFLSAQADAFAGSEREEKTSACFARNDRLCQPHTHTNGGVRSRYATHYFKRLASPQACISMWSGWMVKRKRMSSLYHMM